MKNGRRLEVTGAISKVRRKNVITKLTIEIEPPNLLCLHLIFIRAISSEFHLNL